MTVLNRIVLLSGVVFAAVVISMNCPDSAHGQGLGNTPFDPNTWNPKDWVSSPPPPIPPKPNQINVRNLTADPLSFCYGDGRSVWGWAEVKPGQSVQRSLYTRTAYALILRRGRPVSFNLPKAYVPFHPKSKFKITYRGKDEWDVDIAGGARGRFHRQNFAKLGLAGTNFYKFKISGTRANITID